MPRQMNVTLSDDGNGSTATLQVGSFGSTVHLADLFDHTTTDQAQIKNNVRLAFLIGGYAKLASNEFKTGVNQGTKGLQGKDQKYTITTITLVDANADPQQYQVEFTHPATGQTFGITCNEDQLAQEVTDQPTPDLFVSNVAAFLRVSGFHDLTTPAASGTFKGRTGAQAVNSQLFWY